MIRTKQKAAMEKTANTQKTKCVPQDSARMGNNLVRMNPADQLTEEARAEATPFTLGGNTSATTAQGRGPYPEESQNV